MLCACLFPCFRTTKGGGEDACSTCGATSFIHISDGKSRPCPRYGGGAIYVVDRGYVDFDRLYVLHQAGAFFVTRAKSNIDAHRVYSAPTDRSTGIICGDHLPDGFYSQPRTDRDPEWQDARHLRALQKLAGGTIKQHLRIKQFYGTSENVGEDADLDCRLGLRPRRHRQEAPRPASLYTLLQILSVTLFEKMPIHQACGRRKQMQRFANNQPIEFIRFLTGH